jgi:hypothetical protein
VCFICARQQLPLRKHGLKTQINLFIVPPKTLSPINLIVTGLRNSKKKIRFEQTHYNYLGIFYQLIRKEKYLCHKKEIYELIFTRTI